MEIIEGKIGDGDSILAVIKKDKMIFQK